MSRPRTQAWPAGVPAPAAVPGCGAGLGQDQGDQAVRVLQDRPCHSHGEGRLLCQMRERIAELSAGVSEVSNVGGQDALAVGAPDQLPERLPGCIRLVRQPPIAS